MGFKKKTRPPDGQLRVSQLISQFGPGAMVDLLDHAVLIGGLEYWKYNSKQPHPLIEEDRLREAVLPKMKALGLTLSRDNPFMTGPPGEDEEAGPWCGIQVAEFPLWFVCQNCKALSYYKELEQKSGRYMHQCKRTVSKVCVPVRFVATCKHGHLTEFPWSWFVHTEGQNCSARDLYFKEGATGDFSELVVRCNACAAERPLSEAQARPDSLPKCGGERPWLGRHADEPCDQHLKLLSRTASNAYFSQKMSALAIPEKGRELHKAVAVPRLWTVVKNLKTAEVVSVTRPLIEGIDKMLADITGKPASEFSDEELAAAVRKVHGGDNAPRERIRTAEYKEFLSAKPEVPGEIPAREVDFFASKLMEKPPHPALLDVTLVKKLRGVSAQVGFTRLGAPVADLQGDYGEDIKMSALTLSQDWLPAAETFGEGVLLRFDEAKVRAWEMQPAVLERGKGLFDSFMRNFGDTANPELFPGVRYYMLHSLSHLLMHAMSLECGYAAASLGERIYCAPADDPTPMAAILIMTASSGSEGTLGGLVEQGRRMQVHLERAITMARLCSNDPVCAAHGPRDGHADRSKRYLEGAACHGCMYVAEPSCERFNNYLDRALVVPTMVYPELAFFSE